MVTIAILLGAGLGFSLCLLRLAVAPPRTNLAVAVGRWEQARSAPSHTDSAAIGPRGRFAVAVAGWMRTHSTQLGSLSRDLRITDQTLETFVAKTGTAALGGLLLPSFLGLLLTVVGVSVPWGVPLIFGVLLAASFGALPLAEVSKEAERRRKQMRRALSSYLDLVAMCMSGGMGVPEALPAAAKIGRGWAFEVLTDTIAQARYQGISPWAALTGLGDTLAMPELRDLGAALGLVAGDGAKVRDSLRARASTLRRRELSEAAGDADKSDDSMRMAQLLLAFGFLVFILYPALAAISGV
jgi:Flp pilus assembly protein TadB